MNAVSSLKLALGNVGPKPEYAVLNSVCARAPVRIYTSHMSVICWTAIILTPYCALVPIAIDYYRPGSIVIYESDPSP